MAERAELIIELATGTPRLGLWCDSCLTSGGVEFDIFRLSDDGLRLLGTARRCLRCHGDDDD